MRIISQLSETDRLTFNSSEKISEPSKNQLLKKLSLSTEPFQNSMKKLKRRSSMDQKICAW